MIMVLVVILVLCLLGAFPMGAGYNQSWGYGPSGLIGVVLVVLVVLLLMGRL